jgi:hypothetical protein
MNPALDPILSWINPVNTDKDGEDRHLYLSPSLLGGKLSVLQREVHMPNIKITMNSIYYLIVLYPAETHNFSAKCINNQIV